ncbi:MAG: ribonuclease P protein component [Acidobacteria bacterium]|nr:ribonuclease P protein component [Acidobacteriota bacterium]
MAALRAWGSLASRKVGGAVVRNRVRRLVRESFRRQQTRLGAWDMVVNARGSAADAGFREIDDEFKSLIRRVRRSITTGERSDRS